MIQGLVAGLLLALAAFAWRRRWDLALPVGLIGGAAVGALTPAPTAPPDARPIERLHAGYVSSDTCKGCHPAEYASWHASYHRTMTTVAGPESVKADFSKPVTVAGREFLLRRSGEAFEIQLEGRWRPAELVTGSHHMQTYWFSMEQGRELDLFPIAWLIDEGRWVLRSSTFLRPNDTATSEASRWNSGCQRCHATHARPRKGEGPADTDVAEFGIACEACHGPGEAHVQQHRGRPWARYLGWLGEGADPSVVQPDALTPERSNEVCGQCHSIFLSATKADYKRVLKEGYAYRPGDALEEKRIVVRRGPYTYNAHMQDMLRHEPDFLRNSFWNDGMVRVTGREWTGLRESRCFTRGKANCLHCHEMHPEQSRVEAWRTDQLKAEHRGDVACLQCHPKYQGAALSEHTHHPGASEGSRCQNCHMPNTVYGLLGATRSHLISSPHLNESLELGRPTACTLCHLDRSLSWVGEALTRWYGQPKLKAPEEEAAGAAWILAGDAGMRALIAWHMAWPPAREASGEDWMAPFLAELLVDPYDAVRFIAGRSLRALNQPLDYDFLGPPEARAAARAAVLKGFGGSERGARVLMTPEGQPDATLFARWLRQRDHRRVRLDE